MFETSFSKIRTWRRCQKLYDYRYNQRLKSKAKPPALLKGSILHELLDAHATGGSISKVIAKFELECRSLILGEKEVYGTIIPDMVAVFEAYRRFYSEDDLEYVASEVLVTTDITPQIRFIGYIDKLVRDKSGLLFTLDHKSSRSLPNEEQRFSDMQQLLYVWAKNRDGNPEKVAGVIWDYLKTKPPTVPEVLKNGFLSKRSIDTDYHTYLKAIKTAKLDPKDYADILENLKTQPSPFFSRVKLPRPNNDMIEAIVEDVRKSSLEMMVLGKIANVRNLTRDCSFCEFHKLCHAELRGQDSDYVRKANYETRPGDKDGDQESSAEE